MSERHTAAERARPLIGTHVRAKDPLTAAGEEDAECLQLHLANPQAWRAPKPRADAEQLRASAAPRYVHAPYLINLASPEPELWHKSVTLLGQILEVAASIAAVGVVVHGGSPVGDAGEQGRVRWRRALERLEPPIPVLIEHTAGKTSLVHTAEGFARLWEAVGDLRVGVVYDTCHAHAGAGSDLVGFAEKLRGVTGRIDLTHCNDSRDPPDSGRDRHAHLGRGTIEPGHLIESLLAAQAPVVLETPAEGRLADVAWLRGRLGLDPPQPR